MSLFGPAEPRELGLLFSFFYFQKTDLTRHLTELLNYTPRVFVDSGGFSAFTLGKPISLDDYARWLRRHASVIDVYANFDAIGDPRGTLRNQMALESKGLRPLPVLHFGADPEEMRRYHRNGYDYMCLGGLVPHMKKCRAELATGGGPTLGWLDRMFNTASDLGVRLHGFGVTTWSVLLRYPWASVDSSTWCSGFRFGRLDVFDPNKGSWNVLKYRDKANVLAQSGLLRRYGSRPGPFVRDSGLSKTRPEAIKVAGRTWLVAQRWMRARGLPLCIHLADPNSGYPDQLDQSVLCDALAHWE